MSQTLQNIFFDSKMAFFNKESFTSSDIKELKEFSASTLQEVKELGLFTMFNDFNEFKQLSLYRELKELSNSMSLEDLSSTSFFSTYYKSSKLQEYKELNAFHLLQEEEVEGLKEFKELKCISYYKEFKLLLCSSCSLAINPLNLRGHLLKHCPLLKGKEKISFVNKALAFIKKLEVSTLKESFFLILLFSSYFPLYSFKELVIKENLYSCSIDPSCSLLKSSLINIKRHINEEHMSLLSNRDINDCYKVVAKGQSLEDNKFFFTIVSKDKGKDWSAPMRVNSQPSSAIAMGTIRGAQLALGRAFRPPRPTLAGGSGGCRVCAGAPVARFVGRGRTGNCIG